MKRIILFLIAALMYSMNAFTQTTSQLSSDNRGIDIVSGYIGLDDPKHHGYLFLVKDQYNHEYFGTYNSPITVEENVVRKDVVVYKNTLTQNDLANHNYEEIANDTNRVIVKRYVTKVTCKWIGKDYSSAQDEMKAFYYYAKGYLNAMYGINIYYILDFCKE